MKYCKIIPALLVLLFVASSCDTIRSLLGKPTSEDIERIRVERQIAAEKARQDSIELVRAEEELRRAQEAAQTVREEQIPQIKHYNVIVGSFQNMEYITKYVVQLTALGETVTLIQMKSGLTAISVLNTDDFQAACTKLKQMNNIDAVPFDCWIYDSTTERHN